MINEYYNERLTEKYHRRDDPDTNLVFTGRMYGEVPLNLNWQLLAKDPFNVPSEMLSETSDLKYLNRLYQNYLSWKREEDEAFFGDEITYDDYISFGTKIKNMLNIFNRVVIVGAGGYMTNLWYIYHLFLNSSNIYGYDMPSMDVYDDDSFTYDNIGRIFAPIHTDAIHRQRIDMPDTVRGHSFYVVKKANNLAKVMNTFNIHYANERLEEDSYVFVRESKTLYIGSPDVRTREMLRKKGVQFFFFGHHADTTEILYRPSSEMDLAVESYGRMYIRGFWAGVFHSAISFIQILRERSDFEDGESLAKFKHRKEKDVAI